MASINQTEPKGISSVRGELRVLAITVTMMILFAALNLSIPLRMLGIMPDLPRILLLIYRVMDVIIVVSFFIYCGNRVKIRALDLLLLIFVSYPFFIGIYRGNATITFVNDSMIFFGFMIKVIVFRTVLARISSVASIDDIFLPYAKRIIFWSGAFAVIALAVIFILLGTGATFYFQAPAEITMATAMVLTQGRIAMYLFFLALALMAGKRMIMIGVLVMGLIAGLAHTRFRSAVLRALIPMVLFSPVLVIFGGSFLGADVSFVDKILVTYRQLVSAQELSTSFLEMLKFLDPGRYVEYVSLQPHLTGWSLWFGNGYGFRYELNTDFLYEFGYAAVKEVSNAHFTPLAITAKFGLFGLLIWLVTIGAVLTAKIDKSSYFQYACRLAFIAMVVQSIFAFSFFVNMYTPMYFAMATLGRPRVPKAARMLALQRGQSKGIS